MTAEWLTALSALGTLLVVVATAIAALIQLRHMRSSNQMAALAACREVMEAPETRQALAFIAHELPKRYADPAERARLMVFPPTDPDYLAVSSIGNLLESIGTLVKHRMIEREITCDYWAFVIRTVWNNTAPLTFAARRALGANALWENFEYLAVVAEEYVERHPSGSYPRGVRRMPPDLSLYEAVNGPE